MRPEHSIPACLALLLLGCEPTNWTRPDEFPAHLARGCDSETECRALVNEAAARVDECRQYLVGNKVRYRAHHWSGRVWTADEVRCSYEVEDFKLAYAKAKAWDGRRNGIPKVEGDPRYLPDAAAPDRRK
jgi:hypothetical protein